MSAPQRAARGRLSRSAEFDRVYRHGRSAQHRLLVLYRFDRPEELSTGESDACRIGITVSKKLGGAVERNRLKRQLRELLRGCEGLDPRCDYVAIARPGLGELADRRPEELADVVAELVGRLAPQAPGATR